MISQSIKDGIRDGTAIGLSAGVLGLMYSLAALEVGLRPLEIIFTVRSSIRQRCNLPLLAPTSIR